MNTPSTKNQVVKIAAPYYGDLSHPTRGLSNLYFMLQIDPGRKQVEQMHVTVWNPADETGLGSWLQEEGVEALFCNSIETCHRQNLNRTGIRIESIAGNDVINEIKNKLAEAGTTLLNQIRPEPLTA